MTVKELIEELKKFPEDKEVVMFDGPAFYTPSRVYVADWQSERLKDKVVID